jgi:hypothetical protein
MTEKCTEDEHFPDWDDAELVREGDTVFEDCNCECWTKCFRREYECVNEYEVDVNE